MRTSSDAVELAGQASSMCQETIVTELLRMTLGDIVNNYVLSVCMCICTYSTYMLHLCVHVHVCVCVSMSVCMRPLKIVSGNSSGKRYNNSEK